MTPVGDIGVGIEPIGFEAEKPNFLILPTQFVLPILHPFGLDPITDGIQENKTRGDNKSPAEPFFILFWVVLAPYHLLTGLFR